MSAHDSFLRLATEMQQLAALLSAASSARYEAPPGRSCGGKDYRGISNPTLDIMVNPLRLDLSEAVTETERVLNRATVALSARARSLETALNAWQGGSEEPEKV